MKYYLAYSNEMLEYIKNHTIEEMEKIKTLTELCNGDTNTIDLYIKIKKDINKSIVNN